MPLLDVSGLLLDPMIAGTPFTVKRRRQVVGDNGRASTEVTLLEAYGSINPVGDNSLVREDAYQTQAKTVQVITSFQLRGPTKDEVEQDYSPDIVIYQGVSYIVKSIENFGRFIQADCASIDLIDQTKTDK